MKRFLAVAGLLLSAGGIPVAMATPAQADIIDCVRYLDGKGYVVGPGVRSACSHDTFGSSGFCQAKLRALGMTNTTHIVEACNRATWE
jgi:hypothetical protein